MESAVVAVARFLLVEPGLHWSDRIGEDFRGTAAAFCLQFIWNLARSGDLGSDGTCRTLIEFGEALENSEALAGSDVL